MNNPLRQRSLAIVAVFAVMMALVGPSAMACACVNLAQANEASGPADGCGCCPAEPAETRDDRCCDASSDAAHTLGAHALSGDTDVSVCGCAQELDAKGHDVLAVVNERTVAETPEVAGLAIPVEAPSIDDALPSNRPTSSGTAAYLINCVILR